MIFALIFAGSFALMSFVAALIFYDRWRKECIVSARVVSIAEHQEVKCAALQETAAHWCNEAIKAERFAAKEYAERKRWERLYSERLSRRVN